jgi:hypothetical protein
VLSPARIKEGGFAALGDAVAVVAADRIAMKLERDNMEYILMCAIYRIGVLEYWSDDDESSLPLHYTMLPGSELYL